MKLEISSEHNSTELLPKKVEIILQNKKIKVIEMIKEI